MMDFGNNVASGTRNTKHILFKIVIMIDWCFNGMSTQKGQFVPTAGEGNRLSRLRMANEI